MNCQEIDALTPVYLSGEMEAALAEEVAAHLQRCPRCEREIREQRELDGRLREGVMGEDEAPLILDSRIRRSIADGGSIRRGKWIAAVSIAAMLTIAIGGYRVMMNRDSAVCADAARDHRIEVVDHAQRRWLRDASAINALAAKQRVSLEVPLSLSNYHLDRGKLCRLSGRVFLHLVYSDGPHEFSLYVRDGTAGSRAVADDTPGEYVVMVESARYVALVVTDESREAAREIAKFASRTL
jgi:anti-sigma factor RsiW